MKNNMYGKALITTLVSLLLLSGIVHVLYPDTFSFSSQLLTKITANLTSYTDYQVEIKETSRIKNPAGIQITSGTMKITSKDDLLYVDNTQVTDGVEKRIIQLFDGRRFWYYDVQNKLVHKVELVKIPKQLREAIQKTLNKQNFTMPEAEYRVREASYDSRAVYIFELKEKQTVDNQEYEKVLLIVDKETLLPVKQEMTVKIIISPGREEMMEIIIETIREYSSWKTNTGIPDYKFVLALPGDVQIVDISQETKEKLKDIFVE